MHLFRNSALRWIINSDLEWASDLHFHQQHTSKHLPGWRIRKSDHYCINNINNCFDHGKCVLVLTALTWQHCDKFSLFRHLASRSCVHSGKTSRARSCSSPKSASCGVAMFGMCFRTWAVASLLIARTAMATPDSAATSKYNCKHPKNCNDSFSFSRIKER